MLGDEEDVFESVAWETPAAGYHTAAVDGPSTLPARPGFKQSTDDESADEQGPHDPKWEGYLITSVLDPIKEHADTKDAYVSYLVQAKVCVYFAFRVSMMFTRHSVDKPAYLFHTEPPIPSSIPRFSFLERTPHQRFSRLRRSTSSRQT